MLFSVDSKENIYISLPEGWVYEIGVYTAGTLGLITLGHNFTDWDIMQPGGGPGGLGAPITLFTSTTIISDVTDLCARWILNPIPVVTFDPQGGVLGSDLSHGGIEWPRSAPQIYRPYLPEKMVICSGAGFLTLMYVLYLTSLMEIQALFPQY